LSNAGYHCVNIGKMHTYPFETPLGFDERFVVENKDRYLEGRYFLDRWDLFMQAQGLTKQQRELYRQREDYETALGAFLWELPEETHSDMFVGNTASWWLQHKPIDKPLFLQVGFPGPHPPFDPTEKYLQRYLEKDLPLPDVTDKELTQQPPALKELIAHNCEIDHDSIVWSKHPTREQLHRLRAHYYANITMIDEKIGDIMLALEARGILDNTVVIFTSDHGENLGDHGHIQKWSMHDTVTRVPMIVWAPGRFVGNRKVEALCQHFDIVPVIMELAGAEVPTYWHTESVMPALKNEDYMGRGYVYSEHPRDGVLTGTKQMTMIRDKEWKLVHYVDSKEGELYHLTSDPEEKSNLWNNSETQQIKLHLINELFKWSMTSQLRSADWSIPWR